MKLNFHFMSTKRHKKSPNDLYAIIDCISHSADTSFVLSRSEQGYLKDNAKKKKHNIAKTYILLTLQRLICITLVY